MALGSDSIENMDILFTMLSWHWGQTRLKIWIFYSQCSRQQNLSISFSPSYTA